MDVPLCGPTGSRIREARVLEEVRARLLYRLGSSDHAERFLLKRALLFNLWYDMPHRPTRNTGHLGFGPGDLDTMRSIFREVAAVAVDDGIVFEAG